MQIASLWKLETFNSYTEILWAQKRTLRSPFNWARAERIADWEAEASLKPGRLSTQKATWLKRGGNGHAFPFKVSEINVFPKNHLNKLPSMFCFMKCGTCQLWNGNSEMWYIHLNQLRVLFNSSSFNPINFHAQRKFRAPLMSLPWPHGICKPSLNFTNKAYWLIKNITSISKAIFQQQQQKILDCLL